MDFTILTEQFLAGIRTVERAVSHRSSLPSLSNVLIEATNEGSIKLAATDLEKGIVCEVKADVREAGAVTVPAKLLSEFVGQLTGKEVTAKLNPLTVTLELSCDRYLANLKGINASEFPIVPAGAGDGSIQIGALALAEAIKGVAFAAATDESRPTLTGVYMLLQGETMTLATTDGFRLAVRGAALRASVGRQKVEVIVPAGNMSEVARIIGMQKDWGESVYIEIIPVGTQQVRFHMDGVDVTSQLIDANYPNFRAIVPRECKTKVIVERGGLERALKMANLFARDSSNIVRFKVLPRTQEKAASMEVFAASAEMGDNSGVIDVDVEGQELEIAFNGRYMLDAVGAMGTDRLVLEMTRPSAPCLIKPEPEQAGAGEALCVVMPMHIS